MNPVVNPISRLLLTGVDRPNPIAFGTLYTQPSWPNFNNWTASGFTPTVSGGELTGIGAGNFTRYMTQDGYGPTNLMDWERTMIFRPQTTSAGGQGVAIGIRGTGLFSPRSIQCAVVIGGGGSNNGKLNIYKDGAFFAQSATAVSFSLNDRIECVLTRAGWTYTFKARNLTTGGAYVTVARTVGSTVPNNGLNWIGKFGLFFIDGTMIVESDLCTSIAWKYPRTVFIGDSKTEGFSVADLTESYPYIAWGASTNKYNVLAKANNLTGDILTAMNEIINQHPRYAVMAIGCNDVRQAVSSATWQANYTSIRNQLVAAGIQVVHLRPFKETVLNLATLDTFVQTFTSDTVVDTFTSYNTGTMLSADAIHPNLAGMTFIGNKIITDAPFVLN